ncbi:ATP-dependent RNA helicase-like protein [Leishmania infantum JPCM5]|uniref:RNA helicase n=2 Tax=Leishmania infantum TaxID=5671 RepID=A0A6L0XU19_LEIIN|nr:ATP-dependent RNA helicase-like protein [Leishmania infantum JPCM5]CAC9538856.1 pre-mRNA_splicing_factor_ATP-dependent_RNA_helicase_-_putative [Leishmania infantum]CAM71661.2 ATP-dependent RNA helicase-like protein [Leishmania infantum JPCM5]SUZ45587.1 pre-mRNA_splicing_factor_ATP-dependent_RNA_helicase_-_putative [Leishmania infantum]|eukprot:XP_001468575.2 ATP-dependent RNA helicase-like protein [Leishmania infantum JPCM5]
MLSWVKTHMLLHPALHRLALLFFLYCGKSCTLPTAHLMALKRVREEAAENGEAGLGDTLVSQLPKKRPEVAVCTSSSALSPFTRQPFSARYRQLLQSRQRLPVFEKRHLIQETVRTNSVTLLVGETGSGKTTQVPHFLAELQDTFTGVIACTQPRRIAAISVATRVAEEMDVPLGAHVGYHVRFDSRQCDATRVLYMTDGMLLREAFTDSDLQKYSVVVVDEAHERTIDTDVVLGLLKRLLTRRPLFRLVVMSATLDVAKIQSYFPGAPLVHVSGRMHDVDVLYMPHPVRDYVEATVSCVLQLHEREPAGDILCFLTGEAEIERAVAALHQALGSSSAAASKEQEAPVQGPGKDLTLFNTPADDLARPARPTEVVVLPLYGSLSLQEQQKVFATYPPNTRKIVVATNIAETSVTIDGIVYVVDCGYQKQSLYNSEARVDYLLPAVISKASAEQRKGRAGRTRPGKCFRLFTSADFATFPDQTHPEILRTNIVNTVLLLLTLGVANPCEFPFIDPPSDQGMSDAFYQLLYFGAVDDGLQLTDFGRRMAVFPVDVCLARMLLMAPKHGCGADAAVVAAMLEAGNAFSRPPSRLAEAREAHARFDDADGDHVVLFRVFHAYFKNQQNGKRFCYENYLRHQTLQQAVQVYNQLRRLMSQLTIPVQSTYIPEREYVDTVALRKAVLEGFFTQVAFLTPVAPITHTAGADPTTRVYRTVRDALSVTLHRQSVLAATHKSRALPTWIVFDRLEVQGDSGTFIRTASAVEVGWLLDVSDFYTDLSEIPDGEIAQVLRRAREAESSVHAGKAERESV